MNENKSPKTTPLQINPTIHPMRRNKQQLSTDECLDILNQGSSGVLAVIDENGFVKYQRFKLNRKHCFS